MFFLLILIPLTSYLFQPGLPQSTQAHFVMKWLSHPLLHQHLPIPTHLCSSYPVFYIVNASVTSRPWHVKYITATVHLFMFLSHTKSDASWALSRAVILTAVVAVSRLFLYCSIAISTHDIHSHYWQGRERLRRDVSLNCFSQKGPISLLYSP